MTEKTDKIQEVFHFQDISHYSFKQRFLIRTADLAFYALIGLIGKTLRFEVKGSENLEKISVAGKIPIYVTWHNRIFPSVYFLKNRKIVVMTSQSFDGEYIARFIQRYGFGAVRGSSTRGAISALAKMIRLIKSNLPMCFTIDGPKGPRYVAKMGACLLAKKTGNPVLPFLLESKNYWEIKSWDKFQIPKPFSRVKVTFADLIFVPEKADETVLESKRQELQEALDKLVKRGIEWREEENQRQFSHR